MAEPISTCNSPDPKIKASGTTTWRFTKCAIVPVDVETYYVVVVSLSKENRKNK